MNHYDLTLDDLTRRALRSLLHDIDCGCAELPTLSEHEHAARHETLTLLRGPLNGDYTHVTVSDDDIAYLADTLIAYGEELEAACADRETFYPIAVLFNALEASGGYTPEDLWYAATNDMIQAHWREAHAASEDRLLVVTPEAERGRYVNGLLNLVEYAPLHDRAGISRNRVYMLARDIRRAGLLDRKPWHLLQTTVEDLARLATYALRLAEDDKQFAFFDTSRGRHLTEQLHHTLAVYYATPHDGRPD